MTVRVAAPFRGAKAIRAVIGRIYEDVDALRQSDVAQAVQLVDRDGDVSRGAAGPVR